MGKGQWLLELHKRQSRERVLASDEAQSPLIPKGPRPTRQEYLDMLTSAVSAKLEPHDLQPTDTTITLVKTPFDIEQRLSDCADTSKRVTGQTRSFVLPRGTLEAQIGIILDQSSYLAAISQLSRRWSTNFDETLDRYTKNTARLVASQLSPTNVSRYTWEMRNSMRYKGKRVF